MNRIVFALVAVGVMLAGPVVAQDRIGTIERGRYVCELPGDAAGAASVPQPQKSFVIESASRYSSPQGGGTYLRRGDRLMMTGGPRNGDSYQIISIGFLRKIEGGEPGRLRCVWQSG